MRRALTLAVDLTLIGAAVLVLGPIAYALGVQWFRVFGGSP